MDATCAFWLTVLGVSLSSLGVLILGLEVIAAHRVEFYLLRVHQARMQALALQKDADAEVRRAHEERMADIDKLPKEEQLALRMEGSILSVPPSHPFYEPTKEWLEERASELAADIFSAVDRLSENFYGAKAESTLKRRGLLLKAGLALLILGGIPQLIVAYMNIDNA